ncbi:MAG TPA: asparagine synthetase B, partial [Planctomycetota bacterium]|nr:asparagine synthetase B [Planctomycetota bacterium]
MCGIVGVIGPEAHARPDPVGAALAVLTPRGPDSGGRVHGALGEMPLVLGARRLALVDVPGGRQPVVRPSGSVLVMNGEIYDHDEHRRRLIARGETFSTRGDAEVLAALLDVEGIDALSRIEGSWAFAFWKAPVGPLWIGRDPWGVRPLAWARTRGGLVFASTLDAILATGLVEPVADASAVADVLRDGVVLGSRSALVGVERVEPGEVLRFDARLRLTRHTVAPREVPPAPGAGADPATDVLDALRAAVNDRLRLERPAAVFLSGGIDSALIASFARDHPGVTAWTLAFPRHAEDPRRRILGQGDLDVRDPQPLRRAPGARALVGLGVPREGERPRGDARMVAGERRDERAVDAARQED